MHPRISWRRGLVLITLSACTPRPPAAPSVSPHGVVLEAGEAVRILHQCSRGTPQNIESFWVPSPAEIEALEYVLAHQPFESSVLNSFRQYSGFVQGGRKKIYVNGFRESVASENPWRKTAVRVCDGGPAFFGVVYDVEGKSFAELSFNGPFRPKD